MAENIVGIGEKVESHNCDCVESCGDKCKCEHEHNHGDKNPEILLSEYIQGGERQDDELYCDYKCRLYWEQSLLKQYLAGRTIWKSRERGEVRNPQRKNRSSKSRRKKDLKAVHKHIRESVQGRRTIDELNTTRKKKKELKQMR